MLNKRVKKAYRSSPGEVIYKDQQTTYKQKKNNKRTPKYNDNIIIKNRQAREIESQMRVNHRTDKMMHRTRWTNRYKPALSLEIQFLSQGQTDRILQIRCRATVR